MIHTTAVRFLAYSIWGGSLSYFTATVFLELATSHSWDRKTGTLSSVAMMRCIGNWERSNTTVLYSFSGCFDFGPECFPTVLLTVSLSGCGMTVEISVRVGLRTSGLGTKSSLWHQRDCLHQLTMADI